MKYNQISPRHPERREGPPPSGRRSLATLGMTWKALTMTCVAILTTTTLYAAPIFDIAFLLGATNFPTNIGLNDPPVERVLTILNQGSSMGGMLYNLPDTYVVDQSNTTCGATLNQSSSCQLALYFTPSQIGFFPAKLNVCGGGGLWCSNAPTPFEVSVTQNAIVSTDCSAIAGRPFSTLDCQGSYTYANNFKALIEQVLKPAAITKSTFNYFQHIPSENETTTPCLQAKQSGVSLDPHIQGGGIPLCGLMGLSTSNASVTDDPTVSKLFPPYLNFLLATAYPITASTVPLSELSALLTGFDTSAMDPAVRYLGYTGHVDFLSSYYLEQLSKTYSDCGTSETCPSIYYLPYLTSSPHALENWPPTTTYYGSSGGGGSGAGYQIEAFKPGSATHYTLFSGGGGGGGGNTTPEPIPGSASLVNMINVGSGGGGGSQFSDCYYGIDSTNLNGLGLGAGTGAGVSTREHTNVSYAAPPAVDYSFYPPISHPTWTNGMVLSQYGSNLTYLFHAVIPTLYNEGYTITVSGGGGGGTGLEFLNPQGQEYQPHPVSISYGFNFCYAFNKNNQYVSTDCISSSATTTSTGATGTDLDTLIYQNVGTFYNQGMTLAVLPQNCNGYTNFNCTCTFQHAYVICQLNNLLLANHYTTAEIPTWLINPHCNDSEEQLATIGQVIDQYNLSANGYTENCSKAVESFFESKTQTTCAVPWA
ncbi:MAG: hypothetical protein NTW08_09170 [Gammaproteobacteria bacterium]|nr:hypothetical protein [Gammaproteobacteria bacterium]